MRGAQPHSRVSLSRNVWSHVPVSSISAGVNYPGRRAVPGADVVFPPRIGSSGAAATGRSPRGSRFGFSGGSPPSLPPASCRKWLGHRALGRRGAALRSLY